jgi:G patch domain-containing protein 1
MPGDANQGRDTLTYTKPSIDIFKAIFASDDESDDEDDDDAAGGNAKGRAAADDNVPASVLIERQNAKRAADRKRKLEEEREKAMRQEGPVDLATFKPVFQRRVARADDTDAADPEKQGGSASADAEGATGDASKKKKRKKDKRKGVLSFHVDEAEDGGEWVEKKVKIKPVAATAAALEPSEPEAGTGVVTVDSGSRNVAVLPSASATRSDSSAVKPPAGRKSAADFM